MAIMNTISDEFDSKNSTSLITINDPSYGIYTRHANMTTANEDTNMSIKSSWNKQLVNRPIQNNNVFEIQNNHMGLFTKFNIYRRTTTNIRTVILITILIDRVLIYVPKSFENIQIFLNSNN